MDIVSHGLWGSIAFGRKNKRSFWIAFFFGIAPDLFSFGIFFTGLALDLVSGPSFSVAPPDPASIPEFIYRLYNATHSLIVAALVFGAVWAIRRKPMWEIAAWPLHILVDIPTHSHQFFPTPFLWPVFDFKVNGYSWGSPWIFFPNVALLLIIYIWFFIVRRKRLAKAGL